MTDELTGKPIAFLVANSGVEQVELSGPWRAVQDAGGTAVLLAPQKHTVRAVNNVFDLGEGFAARPVSRSRRSLTDRGAWCKPTCATRRP